jgi:hypothetical protein
VLKWLDQLASWGDCFLGTTISKAANLNDGGSICCFGNPGTGIYGQTFIAPGGTLQSFTFVDNNASTSGMDLVIQAFNGSTVTGSVLFSSSAQMVTADSGAFDHVFSNINLNLTTGDDYIAYLTVFGVANPVQLVAFNGSSSSPLGGRFVFSGDDTTFFNYSVPDMEYSATFTSGVPEPSTWAMMILGFCGLGFMAYRRNSKLTLMAA